MKDSMTREQKDDLMDEVYAAAFSAIQRVGKSPSDEQAESLIDAISEYLGPVDDEG